MTTLSRWKTRACIWWEESCSAWARARNKDGILFFLFSFLISFASGFFSSSLHLTDKSESHPPCLPSVPSLCKPHTQSQHYSFPAVVGRGKQQGCPIQSAHIPLPGVMQALALPSLLAQLTGCANLCYRWDGIFGAFVLEMLSRHFTSARHNPSGSTQSALENAAWPHTIMPLILKPNSLLITLFSPKAKCLQAVSPQCSVTITVPSTHTLEMTGNFSADTLSL